MDTERLLFGMLLGWILWNAFYLVCNIMYFGLDAWFDKRKYKRWKESRPIGEGELNYSQIFHNPLKIEERGRDK